MRVVPVLKHTNPTRYDNHKYGTLWEIEGTDDVYVQVSINPENPTWLPWGYVLQGAARKFIKSQACVKKVIELFAR